MMAQIIVALFLGVFLLVLLNSFKSEIESQSESRVSNLEKISSVDGLTSWSHSYSRVFSPVVHEIENPSYPAEADARGMELGSFK